MKTHHQALLLSLILASVALPAEAADRIRAGQWNGTWTGAGRTRATASCVTQGEADAMNGDVKSIRAHLEKTIPPEICKLTDIKANGNEVTYTSVCNGKANAITTTYHGDSFESVDSSGAKSEAKRVSACK